MNLQKLLDSRRAGEWALRICRAVPPRLGEFLSRRVAAGIAANQTASAVQAVRLNQWVVSGGSLSGAGLDQAALACWQSITYGFYELFHYIDAPEQLQARVDFSPQIEALIAHSRDIRPGRGPGFIIAGVHLAGFDLVAQAATLHGMRAIALSLPEASDSVEWQHQFRRKVGMEIVPASLANLKSTIQRLAAGETVLTGIDRPMPGLKYRPLFFGRPACLPTQHITLALKTHAPIVVMVPIRGADGRYTLHASEFLTLQPYRDHTETIVCNAERVLQAAAGLICKAPQQWAITHPVWTDREVIKDFNG